MFNSPYKLKESPHLSATGIRTYLSCEAQGAYSRNFDDVPNVPTPIAMGVGIALHYMNEDFGKHLWKHYKLNGPIGKEEHKGWVNFGRIFLEKMLNGLCGSRGPGSPPENFRFRTDKKASELNPREYNEALAQEKSNYLGTMYIALEALRRQFTVPREWTDLEFEFKFSGSEVGLKEISEWAKGPLFSIKEAVTWSYPITGSIDLLEVYPSGYDITDYKSGWIINQYKDRFKLAEDIQMTLYSYACLELLGRLPSNIYIQPLEMSKAWLEKHDSEALRKLRILVPPRTEPEYFEDITIIGKDIQSMVNMVVNPSKYTEAERQMWRPKSGVARKAGLADSVRQSRFVPRIGPWCDNCKFLELCQKDHLADWQAKRETETCEIPEETNGFQHFNLPQKPEIDQLTLFEPAKAKSTYLPKGKKSEKQAMLESKNFVPDSKLKAPLTNKAKSLLTGVCPCVQYKLYPIWLLELVPHLIRGKLTELHSLGSDCPWGNCPRRKENPS